MTLVGVLRHRETANPDTPIEASRMKYSFLKNSISEGDRSTATPIASWTPHTSSTRRGSLGCERTATLENTGR